MNGLGIATQKLGDVLDAAMPELGGFDRSVATLILLAQRVEHRLHRLFDLGGIRRHGQLPSVRTREPKNSGFFGQLSLPYAALNREVIVPKVP